MGNKQELIDLLVDVRKITVKDRVLLEKIAADEYLYLASFIVFPRNRWSELTWYERNWLRAVAAGKTATRAVVVSRSAARLLGMWTIGRKEEVPEVALPSGGIPPRAQVERVRKFVRYRSVYLPESDFYLGDGVRCTTMSRTFIDIARFHGFEEGLVALDYVLAKGFSKEDVKSKVKLLGRVRNVGIVWKCLKYGRSDSQSPYESYARAILLEAGYENISCQVAVGGFYVDLLVKGKVVIEIDGDSKYDGTTYEKPVDEVIVAERKREKVITNKGFVVLRYSPKDLIHNQQQFLNDVSNAVRLIQSSAA